MDAIAVSTADQPTTDDTVMASYAEHAAGLERYVRSLVRDPDDAADVRQEALVRLLLAGRDGRLPDAPGAWLRRVAHCDDGLVADRRPGLTRLPTGSVPRG